MTSVPEEYIAAFCDVKSMDNALLATGRIIKTEADAIEISAPADNRLPLLQYRMPVKLFIHAARLDTRILAGVVYLSTENFIRAEEVQPLQNYERRGAFRVNTNITACLTAILSDEEQAALDEALASDAPERAGDLLARSSMSVRVMDISLTGARLQSEVPLSQGQRYFFDFTLLHSQQSLCLRVNRIIESQRGGVNYGCIFFDFNERQMDALCRELFQLQRYEKSRRMNSVASME